MVRVILMALCVASALALPLNKLARHDVEDDSLLEMGDPTPAGYVKATCSCPNGTPAAWHGVAQNNQCKYYTDPALKHHNSCDPDGTNCVDCTSCATGFHMSGKKNPGRQWCIADSEAPKNDECTGAEEAFANVPVTGNNANAIEMNDGNVNSYTFKPGTKRCTWHRFENTFGIPLYVEISATADDLNPGGTYDPYFDPYLWLADGKDCSPVVITGADGGGDLYRQPRIRPNSYLSPILAGDSRYILVCSFSDGWEDSYTYRPTIGVSYHGTSDDCTEHTGCVNKQYDYEPSANADPENLGAGMNHGGPYTLLIRAAGACPEGTTGSSPLHEGGCTCPAGLTWTEFEASGLISGSCESGPPPTQATTTTPAPPPQTTTTAKPTTTTTAAPPTTTTTPAPPPTTPAPPTTTTSTSTAAPIPTTTEAAVVVPQPTVPPATTAEPTEEADDREKPKIEPAPDAPVMHTADWIHAIVLGPDEVPPKLPGQEEAEEDIYGSGYGSGSGSGSGSDDGSGSEEGSSAFLETPSKKEEMEDLTASLSALTAHVDSLAAKLS